MIKFRCGQCRWFDTRDLEIRKDVPKNFGYCRKKYPSIVGIQGFLYGRWPLMDCQDLCAEWQPDAE
jgi:hypothetical protein